MARFIAAILLAGGIGLAGQAQAGLIASYNFDESSGAIAHDSVGSVDGALNGGAAFVTGAGVQGGAVSLSTASNSFVDFGDNFAFTSGSMSVEAWINTTDTAIGTIFARHYGRAMAGYFVAMNDALDGCSAAGRVHFYAAYPCSGVSTTIVNDGYWHQLVAVYDSVATTSSIYVDGLLQSVSAGGNVINPTPPGTEFLVGGYTQFGSPLSAYTGLVDNLRLYDNALSAGDIQALYDDATVPEPASLAVVGAGLAGLGLLRRRRRA